MKIYSYNGQKITPVVEIYHDVVPYLGGITEKEFYLDTDKCIAAWRLANEQITAQFGDLFPPRKPSAPPLSYGHLACLGAPLIYTENGEPNVKPCADDIDEAIAFMERSREMDFAAAPACRRYMEMNAALQSAFPEETILPLAGFGVQGVITTAVLLRGQDFFYDVYDEPEKVLQLLDLISDSIIAFKKFQNRTNGVPEITATSTGIADDFASLLPPDMWPTFVVPYWKKQFLALGTESARHFLHCENVNPAQLKYLKEAGVTYYQPSVSDALTLQNVKANLDIPFDWLLYAYRITEMTDAEIEAWVDEAVLAGVTKIRTQFGKYAWSEGKLDRIRAFCRAFDKYSTT